MFKFLKDEPALFIEKEKILVISDLHLGFEYELYKKGINVPSQTKPIMKKINSLIRKTRAEKLVILGDIKHDVPGVSYQEMREVPEFFKELVSKVEVEVCLGNHDTFLEKLCPHEVKIHNSRGFVIKKYGFNHGHAWPFKKLMKCDYIIMGHTHPTIQFIDKFGYRVIEQVWLKGRLDKEKVKKKYKIEKTGLLGVIIIPAFNRLLGGTPLNVKRTSDELLGPLLKNNFINIKDVELYLLDGTYLGKLKNLIEG